MRVTKRDLENMTHRLNAREGRPDRPHYKDDLGNWHSLHGHILLDHNAYYGGYALREITEHGSEDFVWPRWYRVSGREMFAYLSGRLGE